MHCDALVESWKHRPSIIDLNYGAGLGAAGHIRHHHQDIPPDIIQISSKGYSWRVVGASGYRIKGRMASFAMEPSDVGTSFV